MKSSDATKLAACPVPDGLSTEQRAMFKDLVVRAPAGVFGLSDQKALASYCQLTSELEAAMRLRRTRNTLAKIARLSKVLRQLSLRLDLKTLARKETRSNEGAIRAEERDVVREAMANPEHPRHGLYGARVVE